MSTLHYLYFDTNAGQALAAVEQSSRISLHVDHTNPTRRVPVLQNLSPEQVANLAIELLRVASYNMDSDEFAAVCARRRAGYRLGVEL